MGYPLSSDLAESPEETENPGGLRKCKWVNGTTTLHEYKETESGERGSVLKREDLCWME